ncbi:helix-turn-helix transcriptional regulator [Deinococcus fonticola]|uniref:helix-turn-helix transcriptional regulator n=1 Tax=Deinococcus fonticola TaxID=2528713 RepID=UPI00107530D1|nr:hypothetical protein [Deinococcus fonticola]
MSEERTYKLGEAARLIGYKDGYMRSRASSRAFPTVKVDGRLHVTESTLKMLKHIRSGEIPEERLVDMAAAARIFGRKRKHMDAWLQARGVKTVLRYGLRWVKRDDLEIDLVPRGTAPDGYVTLKEVMDATGFSRSTIRMRMDAGDLPYTIWLHKAIFRVEDLEAFKKTYAKRYAKLRNAHRVTTEVELSDLDRKIAAGEMISMPQVLAMTGGDRSNIYVFLKRNGAHMVVRSVGGRSTLYVAAEDARALAEKRAARRARGNGGAQ